MIPGQVTNLVGSTSHLATRPTWDPYAEHGSTHPLNGKNLAWRASCRQPHGSQRREDRFFPAEP